MAQKSGKQNCESRIADGVSSEELLRGEPNGPIDAGSKCLLELEHSHMRSWLKQTGHKKWEPGKSGTQVGLALSGGGIRSAAFSLGVMQSLARAGWLKKIDYLSTVSGGGYVGSALTWWLSGWPRGGKKEFGAGHKDFPYQEGDPKGMVRYLSSHGNYLTPGNGITLLSGIAVVLRGILLNLLVWIPILSALMALLHLRLPFLSFLSPLPLLEWLEIDLDQTLPVLMPREIPNFYELLVLAALVVAALFVLYSIVYSLGTGVLRSRKFSAWRIARPFRRYRLRRDFERWASTAFAFIGAALLIGTLPLVSQLMNFYTGPLLLEPEDFKFEDYAQYLGPAATFVGIFSGVFGFLFTRGGQKKSSGAMIVIGAMLLVYGLLVITYRIGLWANCTESFLPWVGWEYCGDWSKPEMIEPLSSLKVFWIAIGAAAIMGILVNLNYMTLHRFYRDRLMESFLPSRHAVAALTTGAAWESEAAPLSAFLHNNGPYHLINTNLVLINSKDKMRRMRGGDNFILSPLYCGSNATGWRPTCRFMRNGMTLPTAMAISGAAANPNTGVGGVGLTRSRFVSLLMSLLNIRLGYWIPHPANTHMITPNHFVPGLYDVLGWFGGMGYTERSKFLQLSDGGHFENLGIYELVRRRMRVIIVCDGGADPKFGFDDLVVALRRIEADFGATIDFGSGGGGLSPLARLIPGKDKESVMKMIPAASGHIVGNITYADGLPGLLILMKTTIAPNLPPEVLGYKGRNPDFPDQSTADQFFDEDQFEAYRLLGSHIASAMMDDKDVKKAIKVDYAKWP